MTGAALMLMAKAPEPGEVKTRLCPPATPAEAADVAAAALLDTLDAMTAVPGARTMVAVTGRLAAAARAPELIAALRCATTTPQRGDGLGERIVAAHADTVHRFPGRPTLVLGMDTPQVDAGLLTECLARLASTDAVLGPATDGGWWALGLREPRNAVVIEHVRTSRDDTGVLTLRALRAAGLRVELLPELRDVDNAEDATEVAGLAPDGRFAAAVGRIAAFRIGSRPP
jgi:rSAM/selenodomain-associated transferase 1